ARNRLTDRAEGQVARTVIDAPRFALVEPPWRGGSPTSHYVTAARRRRTSARSLRSSDVKTSFSLLRAIAMISTSSASESLPAARNAAASRRAHDTSLGACSWAFFAYSTALFG